MRYSSVKAAAVAFLGLGGGLLGAHCAPVDSDGRKTSDLGVVERSPYSIDLPISRRSKDVVDPFMDRDAGDKDKNGYKYWYKFSFKSPGLGVDLYDIFSDGYKDGEVPVNNFGVNVNTGKFVVTQAKNADDKTDKEKKLKLRDLIMSFWVHFGKKKPSDLKSIFYEEILESKVREQIEKAYERMKKDNGDLEVRKDGDADGEEDAFEELGKDNPFGEGAKKLLAEYLDDDKEITKFSVTGYRGIWPPNMEIFFAKD